MSSPFPLAQRGNALLFLLRPARRLRVRAEFGVPFDCQLRVSEAPNPLPRAPL